MYWRKARPEHVEAIRTPLGPDESFPKDLYPTIRKAFDRARDERVICVENGVQGNINMSSVYTRLIQLVGRFAESYASDVLYNIEAIQELIDRGTRHEGVPSESSVFICGIRRFGVDGRQFFMDWSRNNYDRQSGYLMVERHYRKIIGVEVTLSENDGTYYPADKVTVTVKDLTDSFIDIEECDKKAPS